MSTPASSQRDRVLRILARLVEHTNADELVWERAAIPGSWAVDIGQTRFRIRVESGERPTYALDIMGSLGETITGDAESTGLLEALYRAAANNGQRHAPDPLADVEERLGLRSDASAAPGALPHVE